MSDRDLNTVELGYVKVMNMPGIESMSEYALESKITLQVT